MHKKSFLAICFVLVLAVSAFGVGQLLSLNKPVGEEYKKLAEDLLSDAHQEFQKIRGVSVKDVPLEVVSQQWATDTWGTVSDSELKKLQRDENIYKALFLISQDDSLVEAKHDWTSIFRAAKWQGTIYVVEENFDVTETTRATGSFVHELTHIMQEDYILSTPATFDGSKAVSALKEGDATLMADTAKNDGVVPLPADVVKPGSSPDLPDSVNKINRFVYRYGLEFVKTLYNYEAESWEGVDQAYVNPPTTTEQIIHPEKYLGKEAALAVVAPEVSGNWSLAKTDSYGEYFVYVMLENWISEEDALEASEGWGGDIFSYYQQGEEFLFTWNIVWDTEDDAFEFRLAFLDMMYRTSAEEYNNCNSWEANGRYLSITRQGRSTVITSSPDAPTIQG